MKKAITLLLALMVLTLTGCAGESAQAAAPVSAEETMPVNEAVYAQIQALLYPEGEFAVPNDSEARKLAEPLAQAGDSRAMYYMGKIYENEYGLFETEQDGEQAIAWLEQGASLGNTDCMEALGDLYRFATCGWNDLEAAESWYRKGAELGDPVCMKGLGDLARDGRDYDTSIAWYKKAVEAGGSSYLHALGDAYAHTGDFTAAQECYEQLIARGDTQGMLYLASMYSNLLQDYDTAIEWLGKGAEAGNRMCMLELGHLYEHGDDEGGPAPDKELSQYWYDRAEAAKK